MKTESLDVADVVLLHNERHGDERGHLTKPFQASLFSRAGLPATFHEQLFSWSRRGVLRGLHLQVAPSEQWKLVTCLSGSVWDVVLDVRASSHSAGRHCAVELTADNALSLLIPPGCAHGFLATSELALVAYSITSEFNPDAEAGVRWDSAGIDWPLTASPIISARDLGLTPLAEFGLLSPAISSPQAT